ncbi:hypothetical protein JW887_06545 [Candidatus Dojkabacteria bacterium]|nr:hypothetical protein [Candidatus Dojkabacteria bacterium]
MNKNDNNVNPWSYLAIFTGVGCGFGVALHNIALGVGIGVAIGALLSIIVSRRKK